ncbi:MAG: alpha-L-fucosidase [Planctomycetota bacterium]
MAYRLCVLVVCVLLATAPAALAGDPRGPFHDETPEERDARLAWWREARFGMFIHWGVYAVHAGEYQGRSRSTCWLKIQARVPVAEYAEFAGAFNPTRYDPAEWAGLAQRAGMRYMVITAKHHDGFALFPSAVSEFDIADASPYGRDLIGPLADASRQRGLKFGVYYSQAKDWHHPGGFIGNRWELGTGWDPAQTGDFEGYWSHVAIPQVGELLTNYDLDLLWWDQPVAMTDDRLSRMLGQFEPYDRLIINDRLGAPFRGDFETEEQHVPPVGKMHRDWEVCMTIPRHQWGYSKSDTNFKSVDELVYTLCRVVSRGGNFLLNVGPNAEGIIPPEQVERLEGIGKWMAVNSESIYGTVAGPFHHVPWGFVTMKRPAPDTPTTLYLQIFDWPANGKLLVPGLATLPQEATLLANGRSLNAVRGDGVYPCVEIAVPTSAPDAVGSVVRLVFDQTPEIVRAYPTQDSNGVTELPAVAADLHAHFRCPLKLGLRDNARHITEWTNNRGWIQWTFRINRPGHFTVEADLAPSSDTAVMWHVGDHPPQPASLQPDDSNRSFSRFTLGEVSIATPGIHTITLRAPDKGWAKTELRRARLIPKP